MFRLANAFAAKRPALWMAVILGHTACSNLSGQLTRQVAASLVNEAAAFKTAGSIALERDAEEGGVKEGLWRSNQALTSRGRQYFTEVMFGVPRNRVSLVNPATRVVTEVTGITDHPRGQSVKEVQFLWKYDGLDELVARFAGQGSKPHEGEAILRLYDDGWRVEDVKMDETARVPFIVDNNRVEDIENAKRETANLQRIAKTATKVLGEYQFAVSPRTQIKNPGPTYNVYEVRVTDVDVTVTEKPLGRFSSQSRTLGFWQIRGVQIGKPVYAHQGIELVFESVNGHLRVRDNSGNSQQLMELQRQVQVAIAAWNQRYPNRDTWIPVSGGATELAPVQEEDSCYSGIWKENEDNGLTWRFSAASNTLQVTRSDGYVSGTLTRGSPKSDWVGELRWTSGDVSRNVILHAAGEGCQEVRTNQSWWFKR